MSIDPDSEVILWPSSRLGQADRERIGPKAASLCALSRLGVDVPPCFFVTTLAFRSCAEAFDLAERSDGELAALAEARQSITSISLPEHLSERIAEAYHRLGAGKVAVRSSATAEDLPGHSFAGQYETVLNVVSLDDCLDAIKRCWASLWTQRAFEYRRRGGIDHAAVEMAVIVQQQIDPGAAGVAFSLDPVKGSRSRVVIESCRGLGEALVSGRVQPDRLVLRKKDLSLVYWDSPDGTRRPDLDDPTNAAEASLDLPTARRLARAVRRLEKKLGGPQDIEWAVRDGQIWFLQARPITSIPEPVCWEDRQVWTNLNLGEVVPDVMTPVSWSLINAILVPLVSGVMRLVGVKAKDHPPASLVAGRLYWNINLGLAAARPFVPTSKLRKSDSIFGGDQARMYQTGQFDIADEDLPDLGFRWWKYVLSWPRILYDLFTHRTSQGDKRMARLKGRNDELGSLDVASLTTEELARMVGGPLCDSVRDCDLLLLLPGGLAIGLFEKACRRWLGDDDLTLAYRLTAAQGGIADTEAGLDLWRLAVLAHADERVQAALVSGDSWDQIRARLLDTEPGRQFVEAWDRFMTEHGHHCRGELELMNARWRERPDYVLDLVRSYLRSVGQTDPLARQEQLARQGQELAQQCRRKLHGPIKRWVFNWSLGRSRKIARDRENWKNEMVRHVAFFRSVLLDLGRRLQAEGLLADRSDIFFLEIPEIEPVATGAADFDVAGRIAERRAEYERNCALTPPPVVVGQFDPDRHIAADISTDASVLSGIAVSPGVVTGRARVILRTDDDQHVEAGEILVAPFTDPAWTPYFLPAAAVVMDMGGVLSHGAIIAREYGIPAVVNVGPASKIIRTGQELRVDGNRGTVTVLS